MQAAIATMVRQSGGVIVNIWHRWSRLSAFSDRFAYSMSKGAVRAMTLSVAKDFLDKKIRCNCISPARVHTPFVDGYLKRNYPGREAEMLALLAKAQPIGRMATPDEVAGLAVFYAPIWPLSLLARTFRSTEAFLICEVEPVASGVRTLMKTYKSVCIASKPVDDRRHGLRSVGAVRQRHHLRHRYRSDVARSSARRKSPRPT